MGLVPGMVRYARENFLDILLPPKHFWCVVQSHRETRCITSQQAWLKPGSGFAPCCIITKPRILIGYILFENHESVYCNIFINSSNPCMNLCFFYRLSCVYCTIFQGHFISSKQFFILIPHFCHLSGKIVQIA